MIYFANNRKPAPKGLTLTIAHLFSTILSKNSEASRKAYDIMRSRVEALTNTFTLSPKLGTQIKEKKENLQDLPQTREICSHEILTNFEVCTEVPFYNRKKSACGDSISSRQKFPDSTVVGCGAKSPRKISLLTSRARGWIESNFKKYLVPLHQICISLPTVFAVCQMLRTKKRVPSLTTPSEIKTHLFAAVSCAISFSCVKNVT